MLKSVDKPSPTIRVEKTDSQKPLSKSEQNRLQWYGYFCQLAEEKGGKVISSKYERMHAKMTFQCKEGHTFSAKCHDVRQSNSWCPKCAGNQRLTAADCQAIAGQRDGEFLSKDYIGMDLDHSWCCASGHVFQQTPLNVIHNGSWCPICTKAANKLKHREKKYEEIKAIAEANDGEVVSKFYITSRMPMSFKCAKGHSFSKPASKIRAGQWCPACEANKLHENDSYEDEAE